MKQWLLFCRITWTNNRIHSILNEIRIPWRIRALTFVSNRTIKQYFHSRRQFNYISCLVVQHAINSDIKTIVKISCCNSVSPVHVLWEQFCCSAPTSGMREPFTVLTQIAKNHIYKVPHISAAQVTKHRSILSEDLPADCSWCPGSWPALWGLGSLLLAAAWGGSR